MDIYTDSRVTALLLFIKMNYITTNIIINKFYLLYVAIDVYVCMHCNDTIYKGIGINLYHRMRKKGIYIAIHRFLHEGTLKILGLKV